MTNDYTQTYAWSIKSLALAGSANEVLAKSRAVTHPPDLQAVLNGQLALARAHEAKGIAHVETGTIQGTDL